MGKLSGGIYGKVHGKIGNLVHYQLRGEEIVRMAGKITTPPTLKQLACRQEMAVVVNFLNPILKFINLGFLREAERVNKLSNNLAVSYNKKYALEGSYPHIRIDYGKVRVAEGDLEVAHGAAVSLDGLILNFSWDFLPETAQGGDDRTLLLAYFPERKRAVYSLGGAMREAGMDRLAIPEGLAGEYMETYISFIELGSNRVANSLYTGSINKSLDQ